MRRAILEVAWMTVVWSRPPNSLPIFGSDESVSSRERYIAAGERGERDHPRERSLELPDVGRDPRGDKGQHLWVGHVDPIRLDFLPEDRDPRFQVRWLDICDQP